MAKNEWCYKAAQLETFIDEKGEIQLTTRECLSNGIEDICTICETEYHQEGLHLDSNCIPISAIPSNIFPNCMRLRKLNDS